MPNDRRITWPEAVNFAALVAAHWARVHRNPSDDECDQMLELCREMTAVEAVLQ